MVGVTIKQELVEAYHSVKHKRKLTYDDMQVLTKLTRSQLILILSKRGVGVSVDVLLKGLSNAGVEITVCIGDCGL